MSATAVATAPAPADKSGRHLSVHHAMLRYMSELCDCPRRDHIGSVDGHCTLPSIRSEEDSDDAVDFSRYSECGCCMADCPDVHPTPTPGFGPVPGSLVLAEEYVQTLPAEKQEELRELAARGELRIAPRAEMRPGAAE